MHHENSNRCICCLSEEHDPLFRGLVRCRNCGHAWAAEAIASVSAEEIYDASYFSGGEYFDYAAEERALRENFSRRLQTLLKQVPEGSRLLEIGCAYGFFLKQAGRHYHAMGCDISAHAIAAANAQEGINATCVDYLQWQPPHSFDLICLWDTIEHLAAPEGYLEKAGRELAPGGRVVLSTGDMGSWVARMRGQHWRQIHPPSHLHYFSGNSISILLRRLGFADVKVSHPPFWRTADAVAFKVLHGHANGMGGSLYQGLKKAGLLGFSFPFQSFDLMQVEAVKG